MRMSPISLSYYYVPELSVSAREAFDPDKGLNAEIAEFKAKPTLKQIDDVKGHPSWQLTLEVSQQPAPERNFPYEFRVVIVGILECLKEGIPEDKCTRMVKVNGASMLYGVAREVMRDATSRGPWGTVMLPTISFYEPEEEQRQMEHK